MAVGSFEELCAGFCEIVQVPPPELRVDAQGLVGFHVVRRGTTVNLVHCPHTSPDHVFIVFELGPIGQDGPASFADLQTLLEANFMLLRVHPPVFSRNPATGDAVLQYVCPLFDATAHSLYELIDDGLDWASQWRERPSSGEGSDIHQDAAESPATAMPNFA
ncbi:MAG: Tir chaperone protein (CesT) family [Ramlibacter sp.]|jgi:hypothetical protein|nr:Tir chaperone protein (CesT) family [Ramlibacter sp.]